MPADLKRFCAPARLRRLVVAAVLGAAVVVSAPVRPAVAVTPSVAVVMSWAPYYQVTAAVASFNAHSADFDEMTPFMFAATSATSVGFSQAALDQNAAANLTKMRTAATNAGKPLVATITDGMGARGMAGVLADPAQRAAHEQAIVNLATGAPGTVGPFDGVDLDYEDFAFDDGRSTWATTEPNWAAFITELASQLHAAGKTLAVSVPPIYDSNQTSGSGYWVYDYPVLGQAVDKIRIMTYAYSVSAPGPIAPYDWVSSSIDAAVAIGVPLSKIEMGIPAYGTNWITKIEGSCPVDTSVPGGKTLITPKKGSVTAGGAAAFAQMKGATPTWDATAREEKFSYVDSYGGSDLNGNPVRCNVSRTVWYEDAYAIYQRVLLAESKGIAGVALWASGNEDQSTWDGIDAARAGNTAWPKPATLVPNQVAPPGQPLNSVGALPARYLDTRTGAKTADGLFAGKGRQPANSTLTVAIAGRGPVPTSTTAVTLDVTVLGQGTGYVTVYPCDVSRPQTSNLNVKSGQTVSNSVITKLSAAGNVCLYTQQAADLIVDVLNVLPDAAYTPVPTPARLVDTRMGAPTVDGQMSGGGVITAGTTLQVPVAGRGGMTDAAENAVLNVTAVDAVGKGYLTVWPCDSPQPTTSNVNFVRADAVPNAVVTALSATGTVCVFASNTTNVIVDTFGQIDPDAFEPLDIPGRLWDTRSGYSTVDGQFNDTGMVKPGSITVLPVGGRGGLAADPTAVILNVTVDQPAAAGYLTVFPCGQPVPLISNVNYAANETVPNLVVAQISPDASTVCIYSTVKANVIVDAFGSMSL